MVKATALMLLGLAATTVAQAQDGGASQCSPTEGDIMGPFYISEMPVLEDINRFSQVGEDIVVEGLVLSAASGQPPVANARLEVWQADGNGDYHPHDNGARSEHDDSSLDLRGTVVSDEQGRFTFRTVLPGREGFFGRHKHFHYRITAPGHRELVTQHYVAEGSSSGPGGPCRSARVEQQGDSIVYPAPTIFLVPN